jgi:hypothetical protein
LADITRTTHNDSFKNKNKKIKGGPKTVEKHARW